MQSGSGRHVFGVTGRFFLGWADIVERVGIAVGLDYRDQTFRTSRVTLQVTGRKPLEEFHGNLHELVLIPQPAPRRMGHKSEWQHCLA